uniref:G domain-containing protein n=1 Tax=Steinernema glaseri TaxID=37863 RepID=A0A1I7YJ70_9BILA
MEVFEPIKLEFTPPGYMGNIICRSDQNVFYKKPDEEQVYECLKCSATVVIGEEDGFGLLIAPHQHEDTDRLIYSQAASPNSEDLDAIWKNAPVSKTLSTAEKPEPRPRITKQNTLPFAHCDKVPSNPFTITVLGIVQELGNVVWQFEDTLEAESYTVEQIVQTVHKRHTSVKLPNSTFHATVKKYKPLFEKFFFLETPYRTTFCRNGETYQITFVDLSAASKTSERAIVVGPGNDKENENGNKIKENEGKAADSDQLKFSVLCASTITNGALEESVKPLASVESSEARHVGASFQCAFRTKNTELTFRKEVEFEEGTRPVLRSVVEEIFYDDTDWCQSSCYAEVKKKTPGSGNYADVTVDYSTVDCEDRTEYAVEFFDISCYGQTKRPKFAIDLPAINIGTGANSVTSRAPSPNYFRTGNKQKKPYKGNTRKRALIKMRCPKGCPGGAKTWRCLKCDDFLYYNFKDTIYCKCGILKKDRLIFRCSDGNHGRRFVMAGKKAIDEAIKEIGECKEFNVVLLGETGAGKSTWINAMFNYLPYRTLDIALESDKMEVPVPCYFQLADESGNTTKVLVGEEDENECLEVGQSATQRPKGYTFMYENNFYRFIDVPGVGDVRGPKQDRLNFQMIMDELQNYRELHAICILTPVDSPRLNVMFRFCLHELLVHLHQDAVKNIVFCFTRAQATNFKGGNSQYLLREVLDKFKENRDINIEMSARNMFYFDNEAFRFLCAVKKNLGLSVCSGNVENSWKLSACSTRAVLDYISTIEPHDTHKMLSVNEAKRIIGQLTGICIELTRQLDKNVLLVSSKMEELKKLDAEYVKMQPFLKITQKKLKQFNPKMICVQCSHTLASLSNDTAPKVSPMSKRKNCVSEAVNVFHRPKQVCHGNCVVPFNGQASFPNPFLKKCCMMENGVCLKCGCMWDMHVLEYKRPEYEIVEVENVELKKHLDQQLQEQVKVVDVISSYKEHVDKLSSRKKRIREICTKFMAFLHFNAVAIVNDTYEEYLKMTIRALEDDVFEDKSEEIAQLHSYLDAHRHEMSILKENIANKKVEMITVGDVFRMKSELRHMDELGLQFKAFMMALDSTNEACHREEECHLNWSQVPKGGQD